MKTPRPHSRSGFSLIELVVTMTILSVLVGIVSFRSGSVVERSKATKIVGMIDTLRTACALYHVDTGDYPYEYTNYGAVHRKLSGTQTAAGWNGPYIDTPLTVNNSNPYGSLHLYNRVTANSWITGFDVDGDGTEEITSDGCMLYLALSLIHISEPTRPY